MRGGHKGGRALSRVRASADVRDTWRREASTLCQRAAAAHLRSCLAHHHFRVGDLRNQALQQLPSNKVIHLRENGVRVCQACAHVERRLHAGALAHWSGMHLGVEFGDEVADEEQASLGDRPIAVCKPITQRNGDLSATPLRKRPVALLQQLRQMVDGLRPQLRRSGLAQLLQDAIPHARGGALQLRPRLASTLLVCRPATRMTLGRAQSSGRLAVTRPRGFLLFHLPGRLAA